MEPEVFKIREAFVDKVFENVLLVLPENIYAMDIPFRKTLKLFL